MSGAPTKRATTRRRPQGTGIPLHGDHDDDSHNKSTDIHDKPSSTHDSVTPVRSKSPTRTNKPAQTGTKKPIKPKGWPLGNRPTEDVENPNGSPLPDSPPTAGSGGMGNVHGGENPAPSTSPRKKVKTKKASIGQTAPNDDHDGVDKEDQPVGHHTGVDGDNSTKSHGNDDQGPSSPPLSKVDGLNKTLRKRNKVPAGAQDEDSLDQVNIETDVPPKQQETRTDEDGLIDDGFNDKDDSSLSRIQSRINAIRKGGHKGPVRISEDDPDLEVVDMNLATSLDMIKKRRKTIKLSNEEEQKNIALALAIQKKWPQYVATGLTVAFVLGDIALMVLGVTQEMHLVNIDALELIEGVVEFVSHVFETAEEAAEAKRNASGESKEQIEKRKEDGLMALMELTGLKRLNDQHKATYDRLRALKLLEQKKDNVQDTK